MGDRIRTDVLFAQPSYLSGAARVVDTAGDFDVYNSSEYPDALALYDDWRVVGDDLWQARAAVVGER